MLYPAVGFGQLWNGWATPVVTREVLAQIIADAPGYRVWFHPEFWRRPDRHRPGNRRVAHYASIAPELRGNVQAYPPDLGWTFLADDADRVDKEDAAWSEYGADRSGRLRLI